MTKEIHTLLRTVHETKGKDKLSSVLRDHTLRKKQITSLLAEYADHIEDWVEKHENDTEYMKMSAHKKEELYMANSKAFIEPLKKHYSKCKMIGTVANPNQVVVENVWVRFFEQAFRDEFLQVFYSKTTQHVLNKFVKYVSLETLKDKFIVLVTHTNISVDGETVPSLDALGVTFTSGKFFVPDMQDGIIIVNEEQHNFLRLVAPQRILEVVDVNKILADQEAAGF